MTEVTTLHDKCKNMLIRYFDALTDEDRDYLVSLESRKIVFGTEFQQQRVRDIELKLTA